MGRPKKEEEEISSEVSGVYQVFDSKGDFVREYTSEASGEKACEMATIFAEELNGSVKIIK